MCSLSACYTYPMTSHPLQRGKKLNIPQEQHQPMHFFRYNTQTILNPLERISVSEFNDGIEALLERKQYARVAGGPEHIETYASTFTSDKYLVIVQPEPYHFIFYIPDDASLVEWRREYERIAPAFLAQKLLPPPKSMPEGVTIPMNLRALR